MGLSSRGGGDSLRWRSFEFRLEAELSSSSFSLQLHIRITWNSGMLGVAPKHQYFFKFPFLRHNKVGEPLLLVFPMAVTPTPHTCLSALPDFSCQSLFIFSPKLNRG